MRVLSIDPGHSTGVAVFDERGEYEFSLHISDQAWNRSGLLNKVMALARPEVVLVEGIPHKKVDPATATRYHEILQWLTVAGYRTHVIRPGQWKGLGPRVQIPGEHARDAATMAKWWIGIQEDGDAGQR